MLPGLPDEMLARAEADLEPHAAGRQYPAKKPRQIDLLRLRRHGERETRQQRLEQRLLPVAQFLATAPTEESAAADVRHMITSIRYGPFCDMA